MPCFSKSNTSRNNLDVLISRNIIPIPNEHLIKKLEFEKIKIINLNEDLKNEKLIKMGIFKKLKSLYELNRSDSFCLIDYPEFYHFIKNGKYYYLINKNNNYFLCKVAIDITCSKFIALTTSI